MLKMSARNAPPQQTMNEPGDIVGPSAPPFVVDRFTDHILPPNASNAQDIVRIINMASSDFRSEIVETCCCISGCCGLLQACSGRWFATEIGKVSIWLDADNHPRAYLPNTRNFIPNWRDTYLGTFDLASSEPFQKAGICISKVEAGNVLFGNKAGQAVMIAGNNERKVGWFVTTEPGFTFASQIIVNNQIYRGEQAHLSESYIAWESLHLFNVQPNTLCVVSKPDERGLSDFEILRPGTHSFNSPFMKCLAWIPTSVQDITMKENEVTTADGVVLKNCVAVLSYQVLPNEAKKLLQLDVKNYQNIISDWAKRTMLHEISTIDYQSHNYKSGASGTDDNEEKTALIGGKTIDAKHPEKEGAASRFRPTLEAHMRVALEQSLTPFGVKILTFALQSFNPPEALATAVTASLALRKQAELDAQAQAIRNNTLYQSALTEAEVIKTKANALKAAASAVSSDDHAKELQILEAKRQIAHEYGSGNLRTLFFGAKESQFNVQEVIDNNNNRR